MKMLKGFGLALFFMASCVYAQDQKICISQEAANKCAENVDKIQVLEDVLKERDKIIEDLRIRLAMETQRATDNEATVVRMTALLDVMMKSFTKPKKYGIIVF